MPSMGPVRIGPSLRPFPMSFPCVPHEQIPHWWRNDLPPRERNFAAKPPRRAVIVRTLRVHFTRMSAGLIVGVFALRSAAGGGRHGKASTNEAKTARAASWPKSAG
jgi:hypothetical protein